MALLKLMEQVRLQRKGSLLYALAWRKFVIALSIVYASVGVVLATVDEFVLDDVIDRIILFCAVLAATVAMWFVYVAFLWVFKRESREAVEITEDGVRETVGARERAFIPWAGIGEIEFAATIVAGANVRIKGRFSEITISNVDLAITEPVGLRQMHRELGQTGKIRKLFEVLQARAPGATVRLNRLALRRRKKQSPAPSG